MSARPECKVGAAGTLAAISFESVDGLAGVLPNFSEILTRAGGEVAITIWLRTVRMLPRDHAKGCVFATCCEK